MVTASLRDRYLAWTAADVVGMKGVAQENRHVDFKLLAKPDFGPDDLRHLAKAVSGFANAEGGVVVWGVNARRDPTDDYIDQVVDTPGVENPRQLLARLNGLSSEATSPGVAGIDHRIIEGQGGLPSFVATFVPEGDSGPYMAMLNEARHRYYRRIGSAFSPMDHSMVADMFGRRPHAVLELAIFQNGNDPLLSAELANVGRGIAVAPYLLFHDVRAPFVVSPYPSTGKVADFALPRTNLGAGGDDGFVGGMNHVLHPGLRMRFRSLQLSPTYGGAAPTHCHAQFRYGAAEVDEKHGRLVFDFTRGRFEVIDGAVGIQPP